MAAQQWYANPTYNNSPNNLSASVWDEAVLMQDDFSESPSSHLATHHPQPLKDDIKKKLVSNLPPFDVAPKKISSNAHPLSLRIQMKRDVFLTTGLVEGDLEVTCLKESGAPKFGKIAVYLVGFEETRKAKTRNFLVKKWIVQDQRFAPSDAVHAGVLDEDGMWCAKKGTTSFPFAIPFEREFEDDSTHAAQHIVTELESDSTLPSSYWNAKVGGVRYVLAGVVETKIGGKVRNPLAFYQEIFVVEGAGYTLSNTFANLSARTQPLLRESQATIHSGFLGFGKKGDLHLAASLRTLRIQAANTQEPGVWKSGDAAFIGLDIKNDSPKKVVMLEVTLVRILKTFKFDSVGYRPVSFSKMIASKTTKVAGKNSVAQRGTEIRESVANGWQESQVGNQTTSWTGVAPATSLKVLVSLDVPKWARTIRYASLVDVSYEINAKIVTVGGKAVEVNIPITILHPSSVLEESAKIDILAPPEMVNEGAAGHVSYVNIDQVPVTTTRTPSPTRIEEEEEQFPQRFLHKEEEPLPVPVPLVEEKQEPVFTSQTTLATTLDDSSSSLGGRLSPDPFPATKRASTLTTRKQIAPLKSFMAVSRSSTARRPIVTRPSPASLKAMAASLPEPTTAAPTVVGGREGARRLDTTSLGEDIDGVAKFDLDSEIDKMFAVVQME